MLLFNDEFSTLTCITILKLKFLCEIHKMLTYCDFAGFKVHTLTRWKTFLISTSIPIVQIILENVFNTSDFGMVTASTEFLKVFKSHQNAITTSTFIQNLLFCFLEAKFSNIQQDINSAVII